MDYILRTQNITQKFGGICALSDISIQVPRGKVYAIIGPNGAGKTTLFNGLSGLVHPTEGKVFFEEEDITFLKPHQINARGMARTFQNIRLFSGMTVLENVMAGNHSRESVGIMASLFRTSACQQEKRQTEEKAKHLLEFFNLYEARYQNPNSLSYGLQRKLEIARAMISSPKLLLLDEPAAGMNEKETIELRKDIAKINDQGVSIILIEHDIHFVMQISDEITVLKHGMHLFTGTPKEVGRNENVIEAYLGTEVDI